MEQLLLPSLKQQIINYFKDHNFKNGNDNLLNYIQILENKYRINQNYIQWLNIIRNTINQCSTKINTNSFDGTSYLKTHVNDLKLLIESDFNTALCNVSSIELLKDLLFFFKPEMNLDKNNDDINDRLTKLERAVEELRYMNSQQCVSIQNIEENSANTNYVVENIDAKL